MAADTRRLEHMLQLREELFQQMEQAEREFSAARLQVEKMESDLRIGRPASPDYDQAKGHRLPQAEARLVGLFRELLKLEDKIKAAG